MDRIVSENNGVEEETFVTDDLNFKPRIQCPHSFIRVSGKRVECIRCHIGYFDNGDFPLEKVNSFYLKS